MSEKGYLPLESYGYDHFIKSFYDLSEKYKQILKEYFNQ
jgi:hypothetical protein